MEKPNVKVIYHPGYGFQYVRPKTETFEENHPCEHAPHKEKKRHKRGRLLQIPGPNESIRNAVRKTGESSSTSVLVRKINQLPEVW